ncbi:uncharacterized protein K460DRAFT_369700 [Cucurbitaria berberidis CBS 394.84]|uniref:Uncharacterized protein n=1 Tax=Cucurbitaria berberidis CBS 394.84 TaxID=1168544 RepID=A0A9P4GAI6_9PLEO|nr:uncharacterized protein K460DRAFT_369700 [Cucurbitaria berberidis CBS 394.84]KAF1841690.1 hypothetical protein K460DRAFT_369700 [Cucurbitaria berberidis CBS 394.84]
MPLMSTTISRPTTAGYRPLSPYTDDVTTFANELLCLRYAESDPASAPPSPASIESFDVLDSVPWRRSYVSLDSRRSRSNTGDMLRRRWKDKTAYIIAIMLFCTLFVIGCTLGGYLAIKHKKEKLRDSG